MSYQQEKKKAPAVQMMLKKAPTARKQETTKPEVQRKEKAPVIDTSVLFKGPPAQAKTAPPINNTQTAIQQKKATEDPWDEIALGPEQAPFREHSPGGAPGNNGNNPGIQRKPIEGATLTEESAMRSRETDEASGNKATPVNKYGLIWTEKFSDNQTKIILANNPNEEEQAHFALLRPDADSASLRGEMLPVNTRVLVREQPFPGWSKVLLDDGRSGFVKTDAINMKMPDGGSRLYYIPEGDTLDSIIKKNYRLDLASDTFNDRRYFANAILHANNPSNTKNSCIYRTGSGYDKIHLNHTIWMWLPSQSYCESLAGTIPSGDRSQELMQSVKEAAENIMRVVDKLWPVGWGMKMSNSIGLTFGYPVGGDADLVTAISRKADKLVLRKYSKLKAGLDTGVSAGAYFGIKGSYGVGAEAGADAEAMVGAYTDMTYEFPFDSSGMLMTALTFNNSLGNFTPGGLASFALDGLANLVVQPEDYLTSFEAAMGAEIKGTAVAEAGIRTNENKKNYRKIYENGQFADEDDAKKIPFKYTDPKSWLGMLNIKAFIQAGANGYMGAKLVDVTRNPETRDIEKAKIEAFVKGGVNANMGTPLPLLSLNGDVGATYKHTLEWDKVNGLKEVSQSLSVGTGELDLYNGNATEVEFNRDLENPAQWNSDHLLDYLSSIKFTKRLGFQGLLGPVRKFNALRDKQNDIETTRQQSLGTLGALSASSYLTLEFQFNKDEAENLLKTLKSEELNLDINKQLQIVRNFLSTGQTPKIWKDKLDQISEIFSKVMTKAEWYSEMGAEVAAGIRLSAGAKGRIDLGVGGFVTYLQDVKTEAGEALEKFELPALLGDNISLLKAKLETLVNIRPEKLND